jgi:hypothetical protein
MIRLLRLGAIAALALGLVAISSRVGRAEITSETVSDAVAKYVCFNAYWLGRNHPLGKTIKMTVHPEGAWAYVWAERMTLGRGRMDYFFSVFDLRGEPFATFAAGFPMDDKPSDEFYARHRAKVFRDPIRTISRTLPKDCTPKATEKTPLERDMLAAVEQTVRLKLSRWNKQSFSNYSSPLRIIIADFQWHYPETVVFVPETQETIVVTLHNPMNPLEDGDLKEGDLPMGIRPYHPGVIEKIRKHGIVRDIRLDD